MVLVWASFTLMSVERSSYRICLFNIGTALWFISSRTSGNLCSGSDYLKFSKNLPRFSTEKSCCHKTDIFRRCQFCIFFTCIGTIGNEHDRFFRVSSVFDVFFHKGGITSYIYIILIFCHNRTFGIDCFYYVCGITFVRFSGFETIGGIWIRWVLEYIRRHCIFLCFKIRFPLSFLVCSLIALSNSW